MGKPAARIGDTTLHGSPLMGAPATTVLIGGKPAWRMGDQHTCPIPNAPPPAGTGTPHGPGTTTIIPDSPSMCLVQGKAAARMGDIVQEPGANVPLPPPNPIMIGCPTVLIATMPGGGGGGGGGDKPDDAKCTKEGHPVDVVTGEVTAYGEDLDLPGLIPLRFVRTYSSARADQPGDLGFGWSHSLTYRLALSAGRVEFREATGRVLSFPVPALGAEAALPAEGHRLLRQRDAWIMTTPTGRELVFPPPAAGAAPVGARRLRDTFGNTVDFLYDGQGHLTGLHDSTGRSVRLRRDPAGRIAALELDGGASGPAVRLRQYIYDDAGDLVRVVDGVGAATRYEYESHLLVRETTRTGHAWCFTYDDRGCCHETWGPGGLLYRRFHYGEGEGRRTLMVDSLGHQWVYEANADGLVTAMTTPLGYREETFWSDQQEMLGCTDRNGAQEAYEYDPRHRNLTALTDAAGNTWTFAYDDQGRETQAIDPDGHVTERSYDARGALRESKDALGRVTRYESDEHGLLTAVILPDGRRMDYSYDRYGFLSGARSDDGFYAESFVHDFRGRLLERTFPDGYRITRSFDHEDRLLRVSDADGMLQEFAYDGEGFLVHSVEADGSEWRYEVDALGATLMEVAVGSDPRAPTGATRYFYDTESQLVAVVLPDGGSIRYEYDPDRRMVHASYPDGRWVRLTCDAEDRVLLRLSSDGSRIESEYDAAGRLISKEVVDADGTRHNYQYAYNADGQITRAVSDDHVVETEYDGIGQQVREVQDGEEFRYEYDEVGRRVRMTYPGGKEVRYRYDEAARRMTIDSDLHGTIVYEFDRFLRPGRVRYPSGLVEDYRYDDRSQLAGQEVRRGGEALFGRAYDRDRRGFARRVAESSGRTRRIEFGGVDRVLRVVTEAAAAPVEDRSYRYDASDNLVASPDGDEWSYGPGNRLLASSGRRFAYSDRGDTIAVETACGVTRLAYDAEGQLLRVETADGPTIAFTYDAFSRRMTKTVDGRTTRLLWDFIVPAVEQAEDRTSYYLFYPEDLNPVSRADLPAPAAGDDAPPRVYAFHIDAIGAVREVTDDRGDVVWSAEYTPLGAALVGPSSTFRNPLRVIGEYWDEETGLGYHRLRYYDPAIGRFLSPDPLDIEGGLNLYAFERNAFEFFDPFGGSVNPYQGVWGAAYENFGRYKIGGTGETRVMTPKGLRKYDSSTRNLRGTTTYHEFKYIRKGGPNPESLQRMRSQLRKDAAFLRQNKSARIRWHFNVKTKDLPPEIRRRLRKLKKEFGSRFTVETRSPPPCFKDKWVKEELEKRGLL